MSPMAVKRLLFDGISIIWKERSQDEIRVDGMIITLTSQTQDLTDKKKQSLSRGWILSTYVLGAGSYE